VGATHGAALSTAGDLLAAARVIRKGSWAVQAGSGLDHVPSNARTAPIDER
jgi:hypothetical protein